MTGIAASIGGALTMAAVSTLGDFIWANWIARHRMILGLTHGTLLFLCMGFYLGATARRPAIGAIAGALVGLSAAGSFYLLVPLTGYSVMFFVWIALWAAFGALHRWMQRERATVRDAFLRGATAALSSGLAFYAISGIWRPFHPHGWDYAVHFLSWTVAFLPGFLALMVRGRTQSLPEAV
jgi:hypothetical protein